MGIALPVKGAAAFATGEADCLRVENARSKQSKRPPPSPIASNKAVKTLPKRRA